MDASNWLDAAAREIRIACRTLAARPGWTAAAIACLAIAAAANTAAFTVVNALLLRPLPFPDADRLVMVALRERNRAEPRPFALGEYDALAVQGRPDVELIARTFFPLSLSATPDVIARMAQAEIVSPNYFRALGVAPFIGRRFEEEPQSPGTMHEAVLSHRLWRDRFGGDPAVVGRSVRVNGRVVVVVGVAPPGFVGATQLIAADLWLPSGLFALLSESEKPEATTVFGVMGRLRPGVTAQSVEAQLSAALNVIAAFQREAPAAIVRPASGFGVPVALEGSIMRLSVFVYIVMALLMAVACANVAGLILARGASRTHEMAIRLSMGASRWQLARQLMSESLVLSVAASSLGAVLALWFTSVLFTRLASPFQFVSYAVDYAPDSRVWIYTALGATAAGMLCSIAPMWHARRVDIRSLLTGAGAAVRARGSVMTLRAIIALQLAVSTVLLVVASLLIHAYARSQAATARFDTKNVVAVSLDFAQVSRDPAAGARLYRDIEERLASLPGVEQVSATRDLPLTAGEAVTVMAESGLAASEPAEGVSAQAMVVAPGYFDTLGSRISAGRDFAANESPLPAPAIVNEALAERLWPRTSALGQAFRLVSDSTTMLFHVVGVAPNLLEHSVARGPQPTLYRMFPNAYSSRMSLLLRVRTAPDPMLPVIRKMVQQVNADLSVIELRTLEQRWDAIREQRRTPVIGASVVSLLGVVLTALGMYGVLAYSVRERMRELGVRLALGARPADLERLVLRDGFTSAALGMGTGVLASVVVAKVVGHQLYGVGSLDWMALSAASAALLVVTFAALYIPAAWAGRLDPVEILRVN